MHACRYWQEVIKYAGLIKMSKIFKSLITVAGREKIAAAIVSGNKVVF